LIPAQKAFRATQSWALCLIFDRGAELNAVLFVTKLYRNRQKI